jgi:CBS domain-containing protein
MSAPVITVRPDTRVKEVAALLIDSEIGAVPVVDGTRALIGIASEADLVRLEEIIRERPPRTKGRSARMQVVEVALRAAPYGIKIAARESRLPNGPIGRPPKAAKIGRPVPDGRTWIGDRQGLARREVAAVDKGTDRVKRHRREVVKHLDEHVGKITEGGPDVVLDEVRLFLQQQLLPLVEAEESHLMPAVERVGNQSRESLTMPLDFEVIRRYVRDIEEIMYAMETGAVAGERAALEAELSRKAVRLQAVVELHVEKESRVYMPLLEGHLSHEEHERIASDLETGHRVIKLPDSELV